VDPALAGITGLVATANGYDVVVKPESQLQQRVYVLDSNCKRTTRSMPYSGAGPNSPQDLQISPDGTVWVADAGDNLSNPTRKSIGLWKFGPDGKSTLFRFAYPDRPLAAQAMLMTADGNPVFITDSTNGPAGLYTPAGPLDPAGKVVPLKHAGDFTPQQTGTDNTLGKIGQNRISGAASSPDGRKIVLRTYSDAYEWTLANGDIVTTITTTTPRITPLPGEPLGEAIAYTKDGGAYLTVSDVINKQSSTPMQILKYQPATAPPLVPAKTGGNTGIVGKGDTRDWLGKLGLQEILNIVIAIGVIGVLMVVLGIVGIRRSRRQPTGPSGSGRRASAYDGYDDDDDPRVAARTRAAERRQARVPERYESTGYESTGYDDYRSEHSEYEPQPTYGAARYSSGYEPEPEEPYGGYHPDGGYAASPRPAPAPPPAPPPPPSPAPARERGVARTHRPGRSGRRDDTGSGRRGGYADEHQGFGDMLD
jgi:hypothetical protein